MVEQGVKFFEKELVNKAHEYGCQTIELWRNETDHSYVVGVGAWNSMEDARKFQSQWDAKEQELLRYCTNAPKREFFSIKSAYAEKARVVA